MSEKVLPVQGYVGTRDFYPEEMRVRNWFFGKIRQTLESFGYEEMNGPVLEAFDVYAAKSGEELVGEQVYHFNDKGERHLAIRPEMTPTVARMIAARYEQLRFPVRWYSVANFMRYERPQKGRLREFYQVNVDLLGQSGLSADFEIVNAIVELMKAFGATKNDFKIRLNNRRLYNAVMKEIFGADDEKAKILSKAIDKKAKIPQEKYEAWLKESGLSDEMIQKLDEMFTLSLEAMCERVSDRGGANEILGLFGLLKKTGLSEVCVFDFSVVRGLDYYTGNVFEVYDESPENRRALFGGGRYDNLVGIFKNASVSGIGFGIGDVTFQSFLEIHKLMPAEIEQKQTILVCVFADVEYGRYLTIAERIRKAGMNAAVYLQAEDGLKKQLQYAEKNGYPAIVIVGSSEVESGKIVIKDMKMHRQEEIADADLEEMFKRNSAEELK